MRLWQLRSLFRRLRRLFDLSEWSRILDVLNLHWQYLGDGHNNQLQANDRGERQTSRRTGHSLKSLLRERRFSWTGEKKTTQGDLWSRNQKWRTIKIFSNHEIDQYWTRVTLCWPTNSSRSQSGDRLRRRRANTLRCSRGCLWRRDPTYWGDLDRLQGASAGTVQDSIQSSKCKYLIIKKNCLFQRCWTLI